MRGTCKDTTAAGGVHAAAAAHAFALMTRSRASDGATLLCARVCSRGRAQVQNQWALFLAQQTLVHSTGAAHARGGGGAHRPGRC